MEVGEGAVWQDGNANNNQKWLKTVQVLGHTGCKVIVLNDDQTTMCYTCNWSQGYYYEQKTVQSNDNWCTCRTLWGEPEQAANMHMNRLKLHTEMIC